MGFNESRSDDEMNMDAATPRLRVSKSSALTLSTTWVDVVFNGTSPYNLNSFTKLPGETNESVWYDPATGLFKFTDNTDHNYNFGLSTSITSNQLLGVVGVAASTVRARLLIMAPTPVPFPLPDFGGYVDIAPANTTAQRNDVNTFPFFANKLIRDNGFKLQICLSNSPLFGSVVLNGADVNLFPV